MIEPLNDPLILAAEAGNKNEVDSLLDRGADIHAGDDYALRWAAHQGHTAIVTLFLKRGNYPPKAVTKARALATEADRSEVVALIDSYRAMLRLSKPHGDSSPNHAALLSAPIAVGRGVRL